MSRFQLFGLQLWDDSTTLPLTVTLLILGAYYIYDSRFNYWKRYGCKGSPRLGILSILGEIASNRLEKELRRVRKYGRVYGTVNLGVGRIMIADAAVIRQIAIKDFDCFTNHKINDFANIYQQNSLVWLEDSYWKKVRATMSPAFTSGRIKKMFKGLQECANDLLDNLGEQLGSQESVTVNLSDTYALYTMDGFTTCGYGMRLQREKGGTNLKMIANRNDLVRSAMSAFEFRISRLSIIALTPKFLVKMVGFKLNPEDDFKPMAKLIERAVEQRRKCDKKQDDMLQLLVDARLGDSLELSELDQAEDHHAELSSETLRRDQEKLVTESSGALEEESKREKAVGLGKQVQLSELEVVSEAVFLMSAALETTRSLLTAASYALAHHPEVQERLYEELIKIAEYDEAKKFYDFKYESLTTCHYLDAVISESLRILPPAPFTDRVAACDYFIDKYNVTIPKGTMILLGIYAVLNDPEYWKEPEKFNPNRFMPGEREKIVPGSYPPFGLGPRHCIGMRFSLTEAKVGLAKAVTKFKFTPAPGADWPPQPNFNPGILKFRNPVVMVSSR